ncbi:mitochondrial dynamin GTPase Msp1 [Yamadazyma tenuis]|nr:mitochondrial dynamin GTPase Msp1 [Yamadazyma tenuis]
MAAGGSYVAYKVEQASSYTSDKFSSLKDFTTNWLDKSSDFLKNFSDQNTTKTSGDEGGGNGGDGDTTTALGATAAAVAVSSDEQEDEDDEGELEEFELDEADEDDTNSQMLNLTKQMIEIRNIVSQVDDSNHLKLPSIVVIGSQSSGKSSVLESIVGHEFLPKGDNMVTKRPIELTLVNTPELKDTQVIEFPELRLKFDDFKSVQKMLVDLNMQVPSHECISDDPINVTIRSASIPDLSLVDLPGYIQVESADQPTELKQRIRGLCNKYLESPNIILAISAANVDLANSAALRAARLADPKGERTLGVITKLDLVDPSYANKILNNKKYPLRLGYVGVITKLPKSSSQSIFKKNPLSSHQSYLSQQNLEITYFNEHKSDFLNCIVSTKNLKKKLIRILEKTMTQNLKPTHFAIQKEFEETNYKFKVEFNDLPLTPQMYLANNLDLLKLSIKELSHNLSKKELKSLIKNELDQKILNLLAKTYWTIDDGHELKELSNAKEHDLYWDRRLDIISSSLTKSGIGRLTTNLITNVLLQEVDNLVNNTQLKNHQHTKKLIREVANQVLSSKYYSTADQVENCIKPFKYEIEIEDREWLASRENAISLLREEIKSCDDLFQDLKAHIGGRKLNQVMKYLNNMKSEIDFNPTEALGFSTTLIERGKMANFLQDRLSLLKMRYQFLKNNNKCKAKGNKVQCPEVYLDVINTKLTSTSILFLNVELLNDFYYNFPRELDVKFFNNLSIDQIEQLAKEDPKIEQHINLQKRKDLLQLALNKIESILAIKRLEH